MYSFGYFGVVLFWLKMEAVSSRGELDAIVSAYARPTRIVRGKGMSDTWQVRIGRKLTMDTFIFLWLLSVFGSLFGSIFIIISVLNFLQVFGVMDNDLYQ